MPGRLMGALLQDIRCSLRTLLKSPGFTVVTVLTLSLGIGATTAVFSVVDSILLRPLPYKDPQRLVMLFSADRADLGDFSTSPPDFRILRDRTRTLESLSALYGGAYNLHSSGEAERLLGYAVSSDFFRTLGVDPILGRTFRPDEEQWGHHRVVIVSDGFWRSHLGGHPAVLGTTMTLNGTPYTIVGVMPAGFRIFGDRQVLVPLAWAPGDNMNSRNNHFLTMIGRLKAGVAREQALADAKAIMADIEHQFPENKGIAADVKPLREELVGDVRPALLLLLAAAGFVLLIACANVANLMLARATRRYKELALRSALGAARGRLLQQILTESVVLALIGGGLGVALAYFALRLVPLAGDTLPQVHPIAINSRILLYCLVSSLGTAALFGLAPALRSSHVNPNDALKQGGRGAEDGEGNRRLRASLVAAEVALALVLLIAAGLMLKSFDHLVHVDAGFDPHHLLTFVVDLPQSYVGAATESQLYGAPSHVAAFYDQLLARIQPLHGVQAVGAVSSLPLQGENWGKYINFNDRPAPISLDQVPLIQYRAVDGDFFRAMGIRLLSGRTFSAGDRREAPKVAIINRAFVSLFWPDQDPIGKQISTDPPLNLVPANLLPPGYKPFWFTVIGVVDDVHYGGLAEQPRPTVYAPMTQGDWSPTMAITVRTSADPTTLVPTIRREMAELDNNLPLAGVATMDDLLASSVAQPELEGVLLALFASLALLLATVGIYGVLSYSVTQRTHEIGIRMALGADAEKVLRMVIKDGLRLAAIGLAIGLLLAAATTRVLSSLLFGVRPTDPATFAAVSLLIAIIACLASYIPARRATKVDPMVALRYE